MPAIARSTSASHYHPTDLTATSGAPVQQQHASRWLTTTPTPRAASQDHSARDAWPTGELATFTLDCHRRVWDKTPHNRAPRAESEGIECRKTAATTVYA